MFRLASICQCETLSSSKAAATRTDARRLLLAATALVFLLMSSAAIAQTATLVLVNGKVATMNPNAPEATSVAIRGEKVIAVGERRDISRFVGSGTKIIDLKGAFAMPGFIESHAHFLSLGESKMMLDLSKANSWADIISQVQVATQTTPKGQWITGRGWHQSKWKQLPKDHVKGYPHHRRLSDLTPDHPVLLTHASGHATFVNQVAMRMARIGPSTRNPEGGEIGRDADGRPTGLLRETASGLVSSAYGRSLRSLSHEQRRQRRMRAVQLAGQECLRFGVTSFQDAGSSFATVDFFRELESQGKLPVRLWVMIRESNGALKRLLPSYRIEDPSRSFLTVRAIKRSLDGALGPHGAWLLHPYEDMPTSAGLNTYRLGDLKETAEIAKANNCQLCVHAIGDRANHETLNIFEAVLGDTSSRYRWRVEHAQHLDVKDIPRFGQLGVIASMQGVHCTSDAVFVLERLGQRRAAAGAYVWRSLLDSGAVIANGTDAPVEHIDPIASLYASVTREYKPAVRFFPKQRMTRMEAIKSYTIDAAFAAFQEKQKGSLEVGKLADIVVLSNDLLRCTDAQMKTTRVRTTILGGKVVYEAKK